MDKPDSLTRPSPTQRRWTWLNLGLTAVLLIIGIWYLVSHVSLAEMGRALSAADPLLILASLGTVILTLLLKTWRWGLMYPQTPPPAFLSLFWSLMLGAYINVLLPFLRLGELARVVALDRLEQMSKAQSLATLVLEKMLDILMLGVTVAVLLTAVTLPDTLNQTHTTLIISLGSLLLLLLLTLIATRTETVIRVMQAIFCRLPAALGQRLTRWTISGLAGLAALRNRRLAFLLLGSSVVIAITSVLTPLLLLWAFHIPLGWVAAAIINVAIMVALVPPTTPGKIGIFDGVVAFLLLQFGVKNEAVIASYTIVYHLIVILPLIILGSLAASRTHTNIRRGVL